MQGIKKLLNRTSIRIKIMVLYCTMLILSLLFVFGIFSTINEQNMEHEVGEASMQTINALKGNIDLIFDTVNQFSDLIYCDEDVQSSLAKVEESNINPKVNKVIQKSLVNMLLSGDYIDSVYIFDKYLNYYFSYKAGPIIVNKDKVIRSSWYQELFKARGNTFFISKSEDVLVFPTRPDKNYITLIREITDKNDYITHLATLMITIDEKIFQEYFQEVSKDYDSQFCIVDSDGNYIIEPKAYEAAFQTYFKNEEIKSTGYTTLDVKGNKMIFAQKDLEINDWRVIGLLKLNSKKMSNDYKSTLILIICLNLIFVCACMLFSTKLIFSPLRKVQNHMALVRLGNFIQIDSNPSKKDEINDLKRGFNKMISSIEELIDKVKEEEKIIAKGELNMIQAQINPHFLYNTLDAVSALALIEDHENCFKMTQALGNFYRNSLNSGKDFVTVNDEIDCIKSYMTILNIRYGNRITVSYDIEEGIKCFKMLKLILQPVIENAVHHGIKPKNGIGEIGIKAFRDENEIYFIVTDDGVGMGEERIKEILEGKTQTGKSGFGLYSLMQRISLYYDIEKPMTIISEEGSGTEIAIHIKVIQGDERL